MNMRNAARDNTPIMGGMEPVSLVNTLRRELREREAEAEQMRDDYEDLAGSMPISTRMQIATLLAEVELLKSVRDGLMIENAELKSDLEWAKGQMAGR